MPGELSKCRRCEIGEGALESVDAAAPGEVSTWFFVLCEDCGHQGEMRRSAQGARISWDFEGREGK